MLIDSVRELCESTAIWESYASGKVKINALKTMNQENTCYFGHLGAVKWNLLIKGSFSKLIISIRGVASM